MITKDGVIWNKIEVFKSLIQSIDCNDIILDLLFEGPCCETVGLDQLLDIMVDEFNIDPSVFKIQTSNQLASSRYKEIKGSFVELDIAKDRCQKMPMMESTCEKKFGFFVSRNNWLRLSLGSFLWKFYKNSSLMTFHYDHTDSYHIGNFDLSDTVNRNWEDIDQIMLFLKQLPLRGEKHQYPILWNAGALDMDWAYRDIFCDIVCETFFSGRTFMMTEKTLRAIIYGRPFLIQGPKWYLKNLKILGFQTFDRWWNEGYDEDPWDFKYQALKQNIRYIGSQSQQTINQWYQEMKPILEHNRKNLLALTHQDILDKEFFYE